MCIDANDHVFENMNLVLLAAASLSRIRGEFQAFDLVHLYHWVSYKIKKIFPQGGCLFFFFFQSSQGYFPLLNQNFIPGFDWSPFTIIL